jgi:hypothetical protein
MDVPRLSTLELAEQICSMNDAVSVRSRHFVIPYSPLTVIFDILTICVIRIQEGLDPHMSNGLCIYSSNQ